MLSQEDTFNFLNNKITIKKLITSKKVTVNDVCNFLGIDRRVFEQIFGSANGMKMHDIPPIIFKNLDNFIKVSTVGAGKRSSVHDIMTISRKNCIDFCHIDMKLLFNEKELSDFWCFINFITTTNSLSWSKNVLSEANLISIAFKYDRSELELYERIWWYLSNMFTRVFSRRSAYLDDPEVTATYILSGSRTYFDMINNYQWDTLYLTRKVTQFEKLFFKYPSNCVPVMFWDTKLYPKVPSVTA